MTSWNWQLRDRHLVLDAPLVMGIVNVTPDSFSDGGRYLAAEDAVSHALQLVEQGADLLDIGGESSRPGAEPVPVEEELRRVVPVVRELVRVTEIPLSIDTIKAEVARQALEAGAHLINDITALASDPQLAQVVRQAGAGLILMHMRGTPATMQSDPQYQDVVEEVRTFLGERIQSARDQGIAPEQVVVDPGIGFGKTVEHNLKLLAHLNRLHSLGRPICLGASRKSFLARLSTPVQDRLAGSLAVACHALGQHSAQILRVHDVAETRAAVNVFRALQEVS